MKVALLIYSLSRGGAERATVNLANYFDKKGCEVSIVTIKDVEEPAYSISCSVQLVSMGLQSESISLASGLMNNLKRILFLRRFIKQSSADVVVGMSSSANVLVGASCLMSETIAIGSERSNPVIEPISRSWSLIRRFGYRMLDSLICLTDETNDWLKMNTNAKSILTIPNGVTLPLVTTKPIVDFSFDTSIKQYIVSIGRLIPSKCVDHSIDVFANLSEKYPNWEMLVLGDGPDRESLQTRCKQLGMKDKIHFVGAVGNLDDWYSKASLFVTSSTHEGFPNTLLEAMSYGLASVSYDCPTGPKDLIEHEKNGLLVPVADKDALQVALDDLLSNDLKRRAYGYEAQKCRTKYSMQSIGDLWLNEFERLRISRR